MAQRVNPNDGAIGEIRIGEKPSTEKSIIVPIATAQWDSYSRALRKHFRRHLSSDVDLDDLVQEVFAKLAAMPENRHVEYPTAYIFKIASNILVDRSRGRQQALDHSVALDAESIFVTRAEQEDWWHFNDLERVVSAALDELGPNCRDAFILKRYHDLDTPQIAERLQISHRMVQKHVANALVTIHEHIVRATNLPDPVSTKKGPS
ncbi:MAG: hypothetical protein C0429_09185 [Sphingopyxis sp.]|nr:hypothetical protein [Sphingopyxis sp.]